MPPEPQVTADTPLSIDSAVGLLDAAQPPEDQPAGEIAAATDAPEIPAEPTAEEPAAPEEASGEGEVEQVDPDLPAIEPPRSWDAAEREEFAQLPREAQAIIATREAERDSRVSKAIQEANAAKQAVEGDKAKVQTLADELAKFLPQALKTFESKWGQAPDWTKIVEQYGAEEAFKLKVQFDEERNQLGELVRKEAQAKDLAHQAFVQRETERLATLSPELSHPATGATLRTEVAQYAIASGAATSQDIANVSAAQLTLAHKAMLWDRAQASLKSTPTPKPTPAPATKQAVRPTAAAPAPSAQRVQSEAKNRFSQTRSIDDAVALLEARN